MEQKRQSSMVYTCKEKNCGRTFEDHEIFKQHMKKRHQKESSTDDTSTLAQSMITELNEIQALKDTVYELTSELKQETESDSQVYARSILEVELEKKKQEKKSLISFETVEEAKLCLTDDFVTEAAKKSSENDDVHSLELFEVLSMNKMNLTYFDKTEQFSPDRLRSLKRIDLSHNSLLSAAGMTHLYNIEIIDLSHNCISSLEGLEDCSTLKQLNLENNFLVSCHELKSLNELEHLNLAFNKIKDLPQTIEMIQNLSKLKELWFKGNTISKYLNYKHDILIKRRLEKLDGQKLYDADFEIARAFHKHFLKTKSQNLRISSSSISGMTPAGRPSTAPAQHITRSTTKFASSRLAQVDENDRDDGQPMIKSKLRMPASAVEEVDDEDQVDYEDDGSSDSHSTHTPHRGSATLKKRVMRLAEENEDLKLENETLKERNTDLEGDIEGLELQNRTLKLENESLNRLIELNKKSTYFESQISSNDDGTETIEYFKRKYEDQLELSYRYIDEIQRLKRVVEQYDMEGDRSDEENQDDQKTNKNNATKKPINRKQSRTLSEGSDDFEEVREPPKRDPRVVRDNVRERIQNNLSKKVVHIKIKADETGINPVLSKTGNEIIKTTKPNSGVGKRAPLAVTPTNKDRIKRPDLKQQEIEKMEKMSNASILSKDSATLSAANKKMALNRKVNPLLKPLGRPSIDGNSSKHSYSENNSVISDQDQDELTMDDIEKLLSSTQAKMSELTKEFQFINSSIPEKTQGQTNPVLPQIPKPSSGKGVRPTPNLDSLLSTTGVNPLPRAGSKISFSIKSTRQQRSLSRQKK